MSLFNHKKPAQLAKEASRCRSAIACLESETNKGRIIKAMDDILACKDALIWLDCNSEQPLQTRTIRVWVENKTVRINRVMP